MISSISSFGVRLAFKMNLSAHNLTALSLSFGSFRLENTIIFDLIFLQFLNSSNTSYPLIPGIIISRSITSGSYSSSLLSHLVPSYSATTSNPSNSNLNLYISDKTSLSSIISTLALPGFLDILSFILHHIGVNNILLFLLLK